MSSIQHKTIRPGSLNGYSYYYSGRRPVAAKPVKKKSTGPSWIARHKGLLLVTALLLAISFGFMNGNDKKPVQNAAIAGVKQEDTLGEISSKVNHCEGNSHHKLIKVSIHQRKLWACEGSKQAKETPVITGLLNHPETETPAGTYHIYAKQTNTTLTGADSRGSWSYPVHYWMPFLDNQYGTYGFHDATWRAADSFGNVSPESEDASHGCIELPLGMSKWLYEWAPVKTTVVVES